MSNKKPKSLASIAVIDGFALFAMFFGAGNILFPLVIGVFSGQYIVWGCLGFIVTGIGIPLLGIYAIHVHEGSYVKFFSHLGKIPEMIIIGAIIAIMGPLFGAPRTETVTFESVKSFLPAVHYANAGVSAIYFLVILFITKTKTSLVDIVGKVLSPVKIVAFSVLVVVGLMTHKDVGLKVVSAHAIWLHSLSIGYETMDIFSAIFFGSIIYTNVVERANALKLSKQKTSKLAVTSSIIGMSILLLVYVGLMITANYHAGALATMNHGRLIEGLADIVLGKLGGVFVAVCVTFACAATAAALVEITTEYLHEMLFKNKLPRMFWLILVVLSMYVMSLLGFEGIMKILTPLLNWLYPCVAIYTVIAIIIMKVKQAK